MDQSDLTHQFSWATNRRLANGFLILGALLWFWLPYLCWNKLQFTKDSVSAVAQVISQGGKPVIAFHDSSGRAVTTTLHGWRPNKSQLGNGQHVRIVYSVKHPERAELESYLWTGQWISAVLATLFCVFGWLMRKGVIVSGPLRQSRVDIRL